MLVVAGAAKEGDQWQRKAFHGKTTKDGSRGERSTKKGGLERLSGYTTFQGKS